MHADDLDDATAADTLDQQWQAEYERWSETVDQQPREE